MKEMLSWLTLLLVTTYLFDIVSLLLDLYAVTYHAARHYEALICVAKNRTELCANI